MKSSNVDIATQEMLKMAEEVDGDLVPCLNYMSIFTRTFICYKLILKGNAFILF
jgi:hypothetical protein